MSHASDPAQSLFNIGSRCPALVVPVGQAESGVPTGLQIVGGTHDGKNVYTATTTAFAHDQRCYETSAHRPDWPRRTT